MGRLALHATQQVLLVNGLSAPSKTKKEMLDRLPQLPLFSPLLLMDPEPDSGGPRTGGGAAAAQAQAQVQPIGQEAMSALGWLAHTSAAAATSMGGGSCCALPPVRIQLPPGMQAPAAAAHHAAAHHAPAPAVRQPAPPAPAAAEATAALPPPQPPDSQVTMASAGEAAQGRRPLQSSPEVGQQQRPGHINGGTMPIIGVPAQHATVAEPDAAEAAEEQQGSRAPEWLVQGIAGVAERSQGSHDTVEGRQLLGRRWV